MAEVLLTDDAREDIRDLDNSVKKLVAKGLVKLQDSPELRGAPLGNQQGSPLAGLRKLVVSKQDYRIVYRVTPDGQVVVVLVVAKRADMEVYEIAVARLRMSENPIVQELADTFGKLFDG